MPVIPVVVVSVIVVSVIIAIVIFIAAVVAVALVMTMVLELFQGRLGERSQGGYGDARPMLALHAQEALGGDLFFNVLYDHDIDTVCEGP
jgi:hypothetical protein